MAGSHLTCLVNQIQGSEHTPIRVNVSGCLLSKHAGQCVEIDVVDKYHCGQQTSSWFVSQACLRLDCLRGGALGEQLLVKRVLLSWSGLLSRWSKCRTNCRHLEAIILSTPEREMPELLRRLFLLHQSSLYSGWFTSEFVTHIRTHQLLWTSRLKIPFDTRKRPYRPMDSDARFVNSL